MMATVLGTSERRTSVAARPCATGLVATPEAWKLRSTSARGIGAPSTLGHGLDLVLGLGLAAMHAKRSTFGAFRPIAVATANVPKAMAYPSRQPPDVRSP